MDIDRATILAHLHYDPETGVFTRIAAMSARQERRVGKPCGSLNKANGYVTMHVGGRPQYAHRLAWICQHGPIPAGMYVDHANGNRADNRLANLRLASHRENLRNCKVRKDNSSGIKGVSFDAARGQWAVKVARRHVGRFETLLDAAAARKSAALKTYGEFARE